jgi:hypothetical protein
MSRRPIGSGTLDRAARPPSRPVYVPVNAATAARTAVRFWRLPNHVGFPTPMPCVRSECHEARVMAETMKGMAAL